MYAFRILLWQPFRSALTIAGIGLCVLLMLFLLSVYRGVATGSVEYIARNRSDCWVLQQNATNILRGTSLLSTAHGAYLQQVPGIARVSPVLLLLSSARFRGGDATLFLAGFDHSGGKGGPPEIVEGRNIGTDDEIVLDRAFARKHRIGVGESIVIKDAALRVVGFSGGTNAFVIQYAFASIGRVRAIAGFPSLTSCYLLDAAPGVPPDSLGAAIAADLPGVEVYTHAAFLANNVREMESGFLPILYAIAALGAIVLASLLTLLLTVIILESRRDFAILNAIGSPVGYVRGVVVLLSLLLSLSGTVLAATSFPVLSLAIAWLSPEVSTSVTAGQVLAVAGAVCAVTMASAVVALRRIRSIYPLEAFA
jgi:putative ABC transport system permease protein